MTAVRSCSGSVPAIAPLWRMLLARSPALVAEALSPLADPLLAWLVPGPEAPARGVASALASALLPAESDAVPPPWLRPDQRLSFRRLLAGVSRFGGALLADGVGSGKTFVALATASALEPGLPIHVLAPAVLRSQWEQAARRASLPILFHSHETLSRGRAPRGIPGAVIVDECHRFRVASTRRYATLAPWCGGRSGVLLSATPLVNRLEELAHQLLLFVRDDALAWNGIASLRALSAEHGLGALAHLVITGEDRSSSLPLGAERVLSASPAESAAAHRWLRHLGGLTLSSEPATRALIRVVLLRALASSPSALSAALARYEGLLLHARDAGVSGCRVSRQAIRRFVGQDADQLVLWPLVAEGSARVEIASSDLDLLPALRRRLSHAPRRPDPKSSALARLLSDGKRTLVFTGSVATADHLRRALGGSGVAWCTGQSAGLGSSPLPRGAVLDRFRNRGMEALPMARPSVLVATDVAAEGLDLPLIERVVHYDLPWTAVRLEQRGGRAIRLGSGHRRVEIVRCLPPTALDAALRLSGILSAKMGLPALLGLGKQADAPWRRRAGLAASFADQPALEGTAAVSGPAPGGVVGVRILREDGVALEAVWALPAIASMDDEANIAGLLALALDPAGPARIPQAGKLRVLLRRVAPRVRALLRGCQGASFAASLGAGPARLRRRLLALARSASRQRDHPTLLALANALRHLRRGHTAGETLRLMRWALLPDRELLGAIIALRAEPAPPGVMRAEVIGILLVEPDADPG